MADSFRSRLKNAWNIFMNKDPTLVNWLSYGESYYYRPDRRRSLIYNERSIINAIYNRIANDCASIKLQHVRVDENNRYKEIILSSLNDCLTVEANLDQTGRAFIQDAVESLLSEGHIAIVPVDTDVDPRFSGKFKIESMRVGKIVEWRPRDVKVLLYNERNGRKQEVYVPKVSTAIVENPFYSVMNEPNSTLQRLIRKLSILDAIDEQSGSGKLDLIIQLPYVIRNETRRKEAEKRRQDIENQLSGSKYGIAYTEATEHITQLNRPVENNLLKQIEYLTSMLYGQLGLTDEIMNGSADEKTMLNYNNRIIEPIMSAITDEMNRKFLTKTARSQGQQIMFFRDPFRLVPVSQISEIADKFTRNEIMTSNEIRQIIGMKPSDDPNADELRNKNLSESSESIAAKMNQPMDNLVSEENQNEGGS